MAARLGWRAEPGLNRMASEEAELVGLDVMSVLSA